MTNYEINLREFANGINIPDHMPQDIHEQLKNYDKTLGAT